MGLIGHGVVFGLGYLCGRPEGRQQLRTLGGRVVDLSRHPEVKRVQRSVTERLHSTGKHTADAPTNGDSALADTAGADSARAAADLHAALPDTHAPDPSSRTPASGFGGVTVAEDSHAVTLGLPADPARSDPPARP